MRGAAWLVARRLPAVWAQGHLPRDQRWTPEAPAVPGAQGDHSSRSHAASSLQARISSCLTGVPEMSVRFTQRAHETRGWPALQRTRHRAPHFMQHPQAISWPCGCPLPSQGRSSLSPAESTPCTNLTAPKCSVLGAVLAPQRRGRTWSLPGGLWPLGDSGSGRSGCRTAASRAALTGHCPSAQGGLPPGKVVKDTSGRWQHPRPAIFSLKTHSFLLALE